MGISLGRVIAIAGSYLIGVYTGNWALFASTLQNANQARVAKRDRRRAIADYNSKVQDRLEMAPVQADATRTLLMGRVRYVKGLLRRWSTGEFEDNLTMVVTFAGHECDGFEQWWLNDVDVELDVDGWVLPASLGTGTGYTTTAAGFAVGTTTIPLVTGSGSILAGDRITFAGDATRYPVVTGITGPGSLELAAPGLVRPLAASAVAVKVFVHPYASVKRETVVQSVLLDGAGAGVIVMTSPHVAGTPTVVWTVGDGTNQEQGIPGFSIAGSTVTITGGRPAATAWLNYSTDSTTSYVRIRPYLGTAAQNVGADLAAENPGKVTATDRFAGICLAAVTCKFTPDVFPMGRPTVTATLRGAKLYDQRLDSTAGGSGPHRLADPSTWAWSENPVLQADHYARHRNGWALLPAEMRRSTIAESADVCDQETEFTLRKTDDTTTTVTLPRYRCGIAIELDADPNSRRSNMDAIMETMAGADGWDGGTWCFRAGYKAEPVFTLDSSWIAQRVGASGKADKAEPVLRGAQAFSREQRINRVTGSCVDPDQRYQLLPFPAVEDDVLVAAKGERSQEMVFEGVNHMAQAQHLASVIIRGAQAGTRLEAFCNLKAYRAQLFDVGTLLLPRHGMTVELGKTAELVGRRWSPRGGIRLQLGEISDAMFDPFPELKGRDPAPDTSLRRPWDVETLGALTITSGTPELQDNGSVLTRTQIVWPAVQGDNIRRGGRIELQYTPATDTLPAGDWQIWEESGDATRTVIPALPGGRHYLFRGRCVQTLPLVRGAWSPTELHQVADAPTAAIEAAQAAAEAAQDDADAALLSLTNIADDDLLTPNEKPEILLKVDVILAEQADIDDKATAQGITTLKTAYDTAVTALSTYLATLTAPVDWDDLGGNTTIVRATFQAKFADVYAARQALLNLIAVTIASGAVGTGNLAPNAATSVYTGSAAGPFTYTTVA